MKRDRDHDAGVKRDWAVSVLGAMLCHVLILVGSQSAWIRAPHWTGRTTVEVTLVAAPANPSIVVREEPSPKIAEQHPTPPPIEWKPPAPPPDSRLLKSAVVPQPPGVEPAPDDALPVAQATSGSKTNLTPAPDQTPSPASEKAVLETSVDTAPPIVGDGSSRKPGPDTTSQQAQRGVLARPNYLKNPEPAYPLAARRRRQEGLVVLAVKVSAQGRATRIEVKRGSGFPALDEAALGAVRAWEFEPARVGLIAVESEIEVPVRFKLTKS